jgi:hypothetical protein
MQIDSNNTDLFSCIYIEQNTSRKHGVYKLNRIQGAYVGIQ